MKFPLKLIIALVAVLVLLLFTLQHPKQMVQLDLFGWPKAPDNQVPVPIVVFICFVVGLFVGLIAKSGKKSSTAASSGGKSK